MSARACKKFTHVSQRCNSWADSAQQLNGALQRYEETYESLGHLGPRSEGKEVLVPLSESLYAVGALEDSENVLSACPPCAPSARHAAIDY